MRSRVSAPPSAPICPRSGYSTCNIVRSNDLPQETTPIPSAPTKPIFPRLSSGPRKMEAEAVARHQRGRLEGAMVEAVARRGFGETTLRELVSLAGVSKATFYEHFKSKED